MNDLYGRPLKGLRISVNQRCNLSCIHCHKEGSLKSETEMSPREIAEIVKIGKKFGIEKVKISGGEPLLRRDICEIVDRISGQDIEVTLTTNGFNLVKLAKPLSESGLKGINISLHSVNPETYGKITGGGALRGVIKGIQAAVDAGLFVKLNAVVFKGLNELEIDDLIKFSSGKGVLQLIELVNVSCMNGKIFEEYYCNLSPIEAGIRNMSNSIQIRKEMHNRRRYKGKDYEIEPVRPFEGRFCMHCTRMRLTSDGKLKPCLMRNDNLVDILNPLRRNTPESELENLFNEAIIKRRPFTFAASYSLSRQSSDLSPSNLSDNP